MIQELLQGVVPEKAYHTIRDMLMTMPLIESPLTAEVFDEAIHLSRLARSKGHTISSPIDCLIAACAIRNNIPVLHRDADFDAIARISTLDSRNVSRFASA